MPTIRDDAGDPLAHLASVAQDGHRLHCHPMKVDGRFAQIRKGAYWFFLLTWLTLPFLERGGSPIIQFDIAARRFHLLGESFNAQDAWLGFFFVSGLAFFLFLVSAFWGRVWCGFACPHTVILETLFRPIQELVEGKPALRRRRDARPMSEWGLDDWRRKITKWMIYGLLSAVIGHVFVSYFASMPRLLERMRHRPSENWVPFLWTFAVSGIVFFNFTWFREQLCLAICPYGRMQSVLFDRDTLVIGYDEARGEPRGRSGAGTPRGDCLDCHLCVAVCPTGIDIRDGIQMECIGCAACIDACDSIMIKKDRPVGLIRYDSERGFQENKRQFWRPRVFLYGLAGLAGMGALTLAWGHSEPFNANILRVEGPPYTVVDGVVRNGFVLHIENKRTDPLTLALDARLPQGLRLIAPIQTLDLQGQQGVQLPMFIEVDEADYSGPLTMDVLLDVNGTEHPMDAWFLGPRR